MEPKNKSCFPLKNIAQILFLLTIYTGVYPATIGIIKMPLLADPLSASDTLIERLDGITTNFPDADIIVTPEYTYWISSTTDSALRSESLCLTESDNTYAINTAVSGKAIVQAVERVRQFAANHDLYIFLSTLPEKVIIDSKQYPDMPDTLVYNCMLIINPKGEIERIDRKTFGSDWCKPQPKYDPKVSPNESDSVQYRNAYALANSTTAISSLTTRNGETIRYFPIICAERYDTVMAKTVTNGLADIVIEPQFEGDFQIESVMDSIQEGATSNMSLNGWGWYMEKMVIQNFQTVSSALKPDGYYLMDHFNMAGMVQLNKRPLDTVKITDKYVVCKAKVGTNGEIVPVLNKNSVHKNSVKITFDGQSLSYQSPINEQAVITLSDLQGRVVQTLYAGQIQSGEHTIPAMCHIATGVYFLNYQTATQKGVQKVVIQ